MTQQTWWIGAQPKGFTQLACKALKVEIVAESDERLRLIVQRAHLLSTLQALRQNKKTVGLMHANVVGRN